MERISDHLCHIYSVTVNPSHDGDGKPKSDDFNLANRSLDSVASLLAATIYQGNP